MIFLTIFQVICTHPKHSRFVHVNKTKSPLATRLGQLRFAARKETPTTELAQFMKRVGPKYFKLKRLEEIIDPFKNVGHERADAKIHEWTCKLNKPVIEKTENDRQRAHYEALIKQLRDENSFLKEMLKTQAKNNIPNLNSLAYEVRSISSFESVSSRRSKEEISNDIENRAIQSKLKQNRKLGIKVSKEDVSAQVNHMKRSMSAISMLGSNPSARLKKRKKRSRSA